MTTPTQRDALLALAERIERRLDQSDVPVGHGLARHWADDLRVLAAPAADADASQRIDADSDSEYLRGLVTLLQQHGLGYAALPLPGIAAHYEELQVGAALDLAIAALTAPAAGAAKVSGGWVDSTGRPTWPAAGAAAHGEAVNGNIDVIREAMELIGQKHYLYPMLDHAAAELAVLDARAKRSTTPPAASAVAVDEAMVALDTMRDASAKASDHAYDSEQWQRYDKAEKVVRDALTAALGGLK